MSYVQGTDYDDYLTGYIYDDYVEGYWGNDVIDGGYGQDYLVGGEGMDAFVLGTGFGSGFDVVADFNPWSGDVLAVRGLVNLYDTPDGVLVDLSGEGDGDMALLAGLTVAMLAPDDFVFV